MESADNDAPGQPEPDVHGGSDAMGLRGDGRLPRCDARGPRTHGGAGCPCAVCVESAGSGRGWTLGKVQPQFFAWNYSASVSSGVGSTSLNPPAYSARVSSS